MLRKSWILPALLLFTSLAAAAPPSRLEGDLEPEFADAILQLRRGAALESARSLEALLRRLGPSAQASDRKRILELEALARTESGDDARARATNERILALLKEAGAPEADSASSLFQLALLDLRAGHPGPAREKLEKAHALGYDLPACHLFLGDIDEKDKRAASASRHFRQVVDSKAPDEIRALAALRVSRLASLDGNGARSLRYAKLASELSPDPAIRTAADATLRAGADTGGFRERAELGLRYDTNSNFLPLGPNPTDSGFSTNEGPGAGATDMDLWLGYVSGLTPRLQWSLGSRTLIRAHFSTAARGSDFVDQSLEAVLALSPLNEISYGVRAGLGAMWVGEEIEPYRLQGLIAPYFRREIRPELILLTELAVKPTRNYFDSQVPEAQDRSGPEFDLRVSIHTDTIRGWWNPGLSVLLGFTDTDGQDFQARTLALELDDPVSISDRLSGSLGVKIGTSAYLDRTAGTRHDPFLGCHAAALYQLRESLSLHGAVEYLGDFSNIATLYRFTRVSFIAGIEFRI